MIIGRLADGIDSILATLAITKRMSRLIDNDNLLLLSQKPVGSCSNGTTARKAYSTVRIIQVTALPIKQNSRENYLTINELRTQALVFSLNP